MRSDDKAFAIAATAIFLGMLGACISPWALPCAALAIAAIAFSKESRHE